MKSIFIMLFVILGLIRSSQAFNPSSCFENVKTCYRNCEKKPSLCPNCQIIMNTCQQISQVVLDML